MEDSLTIDFTNREQIGNWMIVNDGVMGGLSRGYAKITEEGVVFSGNISLENNGGFSSLRSPYGAMDLSNFEEVTIRYRSNGMEIAFQIDKDRRFYLPNMKLVLPPSEEWTEVTAKLKDLSFYQMGRSIDREVTTDDLRQAIRLGFINHGKQSGAISFEVAQIVFR